MNYIFLALLPMLAGLLVWALDELLETIKKEINIDK
jgi:hypothetical protein